MRDLSFSSILIQLTLDQLFKPCNAPTLYLLTVFQELWDGDIFLAELEHPCTQVVSTVSYYTAHTKREHWDVSKWTQGTAVGLMRGERLNKAHWSAWEMDSSGCERVSTSNKCGACSQFHINEHSCTEVILNKARQMKCYLKGLKTIYFEFLSVWENCRRVKILPRELLHIRETFLAFWFTIHVHPLHHLSIHPFQNLRFCLSCRHFYKPLLRRGFSKILSQSAVFFLSAFFHEVRAENKENLLCLCWHWIHSVPSTVNVLSNPVSGKCFWKNDLTIFNREHHLIMFLLSFSMSVLGECPSPDVQTVGLHGHDGTGKTRHLPWWYT